MSSNTAEPSVEEQQALSEFQATLEQAQLQAKTSGEEYVRQVYAGEFDAIIELGFVYPWTKKMKDGTIRDEHKQDVKVTFGEKGHWLTLAVTLWGDKAVESARLAEEWFPKIFYQSQNGSLWGLASLLGTSGGDVRAWFSARAKVPKWNYSCKGLLLRPRVLPLHLAKLSDKTIEVTGSGIVGLAELVEAYKRTPEEAQDTGEPAAVDDPSIF